MSTMASQITTSRLFSQPFIQAQIKEKKLKLRVTGFYAVSGEFSAQRVIW